MGKRLRYASMLMTVNSFACLALHGFALMFMGMLFFGICAFSIFGENLDIFACGIDTVSVMVRSDIVSVWPTTHVLPLCEWQSVYCGSNCSVAVGPTTSYSAVPATQYLCGLDRRVLVRYQTH